MKSIYIPFLFVAFPLLLISIFFSSIYYPVRLYLSGDFIQIEVVSKRVDAGNIHIAPKYFVESRKFNKEFIVISKKLHDEIKVGDNVGLFYSEEIEFGMVTNKKKAGVFHYLFNDTKHGSYLTIIPFIMLLLFLLYYGFILLMEEVAIVFEELEAKNRKSDDILNNLNIIRAAVPYFTIIVFVYLIAILCIKAIFLVEHTGFFSVGLVLALSASLIIFSPSLILKLRFSISNISRIKYAIAIIKTAVGVYAIVKTLKFLYMQPLDSYEGEDFFKFITDFMKFIFGY